MKNIYQSMQPPFKEGSLRARMSDIHRRWAWLMPGLTIGKLANLGLAIWQFI